MSRSAGHRQQERGCQRAFTDLFRRCRLASFPKGDFLRAGDVTSAVDRTIGRVTLRLAGSVPAANSVRLPKRHEDSLGAAGRFLYLQLRLAPGKPYAVHADVTAGDRGLHRLTVSNLHAGREEARMKRSGVQVFMPAEHDAWTLLAIDLQTLTRQATRSPYAHLRALQLCANMHVRAAFTSSVKYDWQSLPEDLRFTTSFDTSQARVQWVPQEPEEADVAVAPPERRPTAPRPAVPAGLAGPLKRAAAAPPAADPVPPDSPQQLVPCPLAQPHWVSAFSGSRPTLLHWVPAAGGSSDDGAQRDEIVYAAGSLIVGMRPAAGASQRYLQGHVRPVRALALSADGSRLASAEEGAGAAIRLWDFRQGRCLATVPGHAGALTCLDLSSDGCLLVTAGVDAQGRQELACWDVSGCWPPSASAAAQGSHGSGPVELARQGVDHNIQAVKWVPLNGRLPAAAGPQPQLVTCGKNSVRVFRLKGGQLRGASVSMDGVAAPVRRAYSCGTLATDPGISGGVGEVFTCLAWERPPAGQPLRALPRLLAGTLSGAVYMIDVENRTVEGAAQLHSGAVAALAAHAGFVVSGSTDRLLRLWGSDLQQASMEAQHEGPVTGIALSLDGLRMAVGTDTGALGLLDVRSQTYVTLLRSHTAPVTAVAVMGQAPGQEGQQQHYCTGGLDGTVGVWEGATHQQLVELAAPGEAVVSLACHPSKTEVACGFQSGALRVWDADSTALLHESQQHTGAVTQLAFARHGRLLLSLGEDGCLAAYDVQRAHMPTAYLVAGFPLHAACMAVSTDGRLLAAAALSMATNIMQPASSSKGSASSAAATQAQPVIALFDTLTLQPLLHMPVPGSSPVVQVQLLPDARHVLAATADGRLLGFSCSSGGLVLDVPRCLPGPALCSALDPSGNFLVAGTAGGRLTVLGLHALATAAGDASPAGERQDGAEQLSIRGSTSSSLITALPAQDVTFATGAGVLGAAFAAASRQLLTVGEAGEVCCWAFDGAACRAPMASSRSLDATGAAVAGQPQQPAGGSGSQQAAEPAAPANTPGSGDRPAVWPVLQPAAGSSEAAEAQCTTVLAQASAEAPRALPAAMRCRLRPRLPSAPLDRTVIAQVTVAGTTGPQQQSSSSLPATLMGRRSSSRRESPFWERQGQPPEASLLISTAGGKRCAQVVRGERRLVVTSPTAGAGGGKAGQQRSAAWVDGEVAADRIPPYRPEQQLQLLPPSAAVRHVHGFEAVAGFHHTHAAEEPAHHSQSSTPQHQQFLFAAGNVVVTEDFAAEAGQQAQQRHLARLPGRITALALSPDSRLAAAAVEPEPVPGGGSADIHLLDFAAGEMLAVLSHHSYTVTALAFSPDGRLLASLGSSGSGDSSSLAFWDVGPAGCELAAGAQLPGTAAVLAWCMSGEQAVLYTAGPQGLTHWHLADDHLASTAVHLPAALRGVPLTAVAWAEGKGQAAARGTRWRPADQIDAVLVGDSGGRTWLLAVDEGQDVRHSQLLAELPGQPVNCLAAEGSLVAAGAADGTLLLLAAEAESDKREAWKLLCSERLDGAVAVAQLDAGNGVVAAATCTGTLWQVVPGAQPRVLLCGQAQALHSWRLAPGAAWKGEPAAASLASTAGVSVWRLPVGKHPPSRAPLVEFSMPADATHACLADDASCCAAASADGSICLFDVDEARMRWRVAGAERQGGVAALALVQRLRGCKVLVAYRSGALFLLDGSSGQTAHRIMQFAVQQDSGRRSASAFLVAGLTVCPTDSSLFALSGEQDVVVCRAHFLKNAEVRALARLSFRAPDHAAAGSGTAAMDPAAAAPAAVQVAFSRAHAGHLYCTDTSSPGALMLLDYTSQAVVKTLVAPLADRSSAITALALNPDESLLAAGTSAGTVLLLRLETEAWTELAAHATGVPVKGLAFSSCGARLWSAAGTATLEWEVQHR